MDMPIRLMPASPPLPVEPTGPADSNAGSSACATDSPAYHILHVTRPGQTTSILNVKAVTGKDNLRHLQRRMKTKGRFLDSPILASVLLSAFIALLSSVPARAGESAMTAVSGTTLTDYVTPSAIGRHDGNDNAPTTQPPKVTLVAVQPQASETGPTPALLIVLRDNAPDTDLPVHYAVGGSAENETDYQPLRGSVTIPAGQFFAPIIVTPVDDNLAESRETVVVELHAPGTMNTAPYHVAWPGRAVAVIADNDMPENRPPTARLRLPRNNSILHGPLDITLQADAFDPDGRVEQVEFFAGEVSLGVALNNTGSFDPELIAVNLQELNELERPENLPGFDAAESGFLPDNSDLTIAPGTVFRLMWEDAPVGQHSLTVVATDNSGASSTSESVSIEIAQDNSQPVVSIVARDPLAAEAASANDEIDTARFVIRRTGPTDSALDVFISFSGTAENAVDFRETPTTLTIPAGERATSLDIVPLDDAEVEGRENVIVRVKPPACLDIVPPPADCYLVGRRNRAEAHIRDNDTNNENHPPAAQIALPSSGSTLPAGSDIAIVAQARDRDGRVVSVEFFADNHSLGVVNAPVPSTDATTGNFNVLPPFHLKWENVPPGSFALTVEATDDIGAKTRSRPVEIKVTEIAAPVVVNIVAVDDAAAEPSPGADGSATPTTLDEGRLQIRIRGQRAEPFTLHYRVSGSAINGVDYHKLSGSVLVHPERETVNLNVTPIDDQLVEGPESVIVTLIPGAAIDVFPPPRLGYLVGENPRARVVIRDNDNAMENRPPQVELARPNQGERFRAGSDIHLLATANDRDGRVTAVEFFANGDSLGVLAANDAPAATGLHSEGEDTASAAGRVFRMTWSDAAAGAYRITVAATDDQAATTLSPGRDIRVMPPERQVVTVEAIDPRASEGRNQAAMEALAHEASIAVFRIRRNGDLAIELPVQFHLGGSALNGEDYLPIPENIVIPAGRDSVNVIVVPIDDDAVERMESVILEIQAPICALVEPPPPACYLVGQPGRAIAHIHDNDEDRNHPPRINIATPRPGSRYVAPADIGLTAHARDSDGWVTLVEFFANETKIGESVVHYIQPPEPGQRQVFALGWNAVLKGDYRLQARATDNLGAVFESAPVHISVRPESANQLLHLRAIDPIASESPHAGGEPNVARFIISREGPADSRILVPLEISGTADNGADYQSIDGTIRLLEGESSAEVRIVPIDDNTPEHRETVTLKLLEPALLPPDDGVTPAIALPAPYDLGRAKAAAVILDNDRVAPPNDRNDFATARKVDKGVVMLTLTTPNLPGAAGEAVVEASENLIDWFPLANATVVDGVIHFVDAEAASKRNLFYRVVSANEDVRQATGF